MRVQQHSIHFTLAKSWILHFAMAAAVRAGGLRLLRSRLFSCVSSSLLISEAGSDVFAFTSNGYNLVIGRLVYPFAVLISAERNRTSLP